MHNAAILIPAYEPSPSLPELVRTLADGFRAVVVVDDGSVRTRDVFRSLPRRGNVLLLSHPENRGKGAALKTGFRAIRERYPDALGAITADADGQHLPEDVHKVAEAMSANPGRPVLGVRNFGRGTPFRSRLGNLWTCAEFFLLTGRRIRDTQSGLRGIPSAMLDGLAAIPGERYEYEIRMLVDFVRRSPPLQIPVATVYLDGNSSSHFRPLADTLRTQSALFAAAFGR